MTWEEEISVLKCMPDFNQLMIALQEAGIVDVKDEKQLMKCPVLRKFALKTIKMRSTDYSSGNKAGHI